MKKVLKNYWVVVSVHGDPFTDSLSYNRKTAIKWFINDTGHEWDYYKKLGAKSIKVNVTFEQV